MKRRGSDTPPPTYHASRPDWADGYTQLTYDLVVPELRALDKLLEEAQKPLTPPVQCKCVGEHTKACPAKLSKARPPTPEPAVVYTAPEPSRPSLFQRMREWLFGVPEPAPKNDF